MERNCQYILIAEDDDDDRIIMTKAFERVEPAVHLQFVNDGEALLRYLKKKEEYENAKSWARPCPVVLDLNMPNMGGHEIIQILRDDEMFCALPIVVLSTSDSVSDVNQAYSDCANAFVKKPASFRGFCDLAQELSHFWLETAILPDQSEEACKKSELRTKKVL